MTVEGGSKPQQEFPKEWERAMDNPRDILTEGEKLVLFRAFDVAFRPWQEAWKVRHPERLEDQVLLSSSLDLETARRDLREIRPEMVKKICSIYDNYPKVDEETVRELQPLFDKQEEISHLIAVYKLQNGRPIDDPEAEKVILRSLVKTLWEQEFIPKNPIEAQKRVAIISIIYRRLAGTSKDDQRGVRFLMGVPEPKRSNN